MHGTFREPPPPLKVAGSGYFICPLCRAEPQHLTLGGCSSFLCAGCAVYWGEAVVVRDGNGEWDDSGVPCHATRVPNITIEDGPERLVCVLGADHSDEHGRTTDHIALGGFRWSAEAASDRIE